MVCERWLKFVNFLADMGPKPSPKHSIDRKDNDGNYEPDNCRWATALEQSNNQRKMRKSNSSGARGVARRGNIFEARIGLKGKLRYLGRFGDIASASDAYEKARAEKEKHAI